MIDPISTSQSTETKTNINFATLRDIQDAAPVLHDILVSDIPLEEKRRRLLAFVPAHLDDMMEQQPDMPHLEWILAQKCANVLQNLLSVRNERLAGFGFLSHLVTVLTDPSAPPASPGFLEEVTRLFQGLMGVTTMYRQPPPVFLSQRGREAARLRSTDLSEMSGMASAWIRRYPHGLDDEVMRRRSENRSRIMARFNVTDLEWNDWRWQTRHVIRNPDTLRRLVYLSDGEYEAVSLARRHHLPFGITPYYVSLMDDGADRTRDTAIRAQVIPPLDYVTMTAQAQRGGRKKLDFMSENDTSPIDGVTRRYPRIVILKPVLTCPQICVYCQRNWEITDPHADEAALGRRRLSAALDWIRNTPSVAEVLVTGGDPLLLGDDRLDAILSELAAMPHVERIRLGTRTFVTLPQRVTDTLVRRVARFHEPGRREILVVTHVEHPYEVTPETMTAVQRFRRNGIGVYNQLVYTFHNSRRFEAAGLRHLLRLVGITPYYTFNTKGKEETASYRVPIARLLQEQHEEARLMPGSVRTDEIVFNVPRLGKNYLRAAQHHGVISILADGRRVYEFHPWEKHMTLADTYLHADVSIHDYLSRLAAVGEDPKEYDTIWYYY